MDGRMAGGRGWIDGWMDDGRMEVGM